jgi:predicted ABC-class ATPase
MYRIHNVSSILVVGGCSDYLIADLVLMMENYHARDVTEEAHSLMPHKLENTDEFTFKDRSVVLSTLCSGDRPPKPRSLTTIQMSRSDDLDLSALNQLVQTSQTRLIAEALWFLNAAGGQRMLRQEVEKVVEEWEEGMLNGDGGEEGWFAAIRAIDLGMAINRIRGMKTKI